MKPLIKPHCSDEVYCDVNNIPSAKKRNKLKKSKIKGMVEVLIPVPLSRTTQKQKWKKNEIIDL